MPIFYTINDEHFPIFDLLWRNREQVAIDTWLISDSTNQHCIITMYIAALLPHVQNWMVGKFWLTKYAKWMNGLLLLPIACPWQIESINVVDYHCWFLLNLKPVRCRWRRVPCFARAGHIIVFDRLMTKINAGHLILVITMWSYDAGLISCNVYVEFDPLEHYWPSNIFLIG